LEWHFNPGGVIETIESDKEERFPSWAYAYNLGLLGWLSENRMEEHIGAGVMQRCCGIHHGRRAS